MTHLRSRKMTQAKNATWRRASTRSSIIHAEGVRGGSASSTRSVASSLFVLKVRPESTFSHILARAKSNEGGYLATFAAQRWNKAMVQFWQANPGQFSRVPKGKVTRQKKELPTKDPGARSVRPSKEVQAPGRKPAQLFSLFSF